MLILMLDILQTFFLYAWIPHRKNRIAFFIKTFSLFWELVALEYPKYALNGTRVHEMVLTITCEPRTQISCFQAFFTMF